MKKLLKFLKKYDRLISYIIALASISLYFFPKIINPRLDIIVQDFTEVYTIKKPIDGLKIKYFEKDLKEDSLNLKILKIRLINNRRNNILVEHYDKNIPFGINIKNSTILGFNVTECNDKYLKNNLLNKIDGNTIYFNKVLFDGKKFIEFEIPVLYKKNDETTITILGKITGIEELTLSKKDSWRAKDWLNLILIIAGFVLFVFIIGKFFEYLYLFLDYLRESYREKRLKNKYLKVYGTLNENKILIIELYKECGKKETYEILQTLSDHEKLENNYVKELEIIGSVETCNSLIKGKIVYNKEELEYESTLIDFVEKLKEKSLLEINDNRIVNIEPELIVEIENALDIFKYT